MGLTKTGNSKGCLGNKREVIYEFYPDTPRHFDFLPVHISRPCEMSDEYRGEKLRDIIFWPVRKL